MFINQRFINIYTQQTLKAQEILITHRTVKNNYCSLLHYIYACRRCSIKCNLHNLIKYLVIQLCNKRLYLKIIYSNSHICKKTLSDSSLMIKHLIYFRSTQDYTLQTKLSLQFPCSPSNYFILFQFCLDEYFPFVLQHSTSLYV